MADTTSVKPRPVFFFDIDNCVSDYISPVFRSPLISVSALSSQYVKQ